VLEAARSDDLENPARTVAGVPERVPLIARLERQISGVGVDHVVAEQRAHPPFEHEAVFVLAAVLVKRRAEAPRRDRVLDEREAAARFLGPDHEAHAHRPEVGVLALRGAELARSLGGVEAAKGLGEVGHRIAFR
jgi:hypothetical protein